MKFTQVLDAVRNIKKQKVSFFSVVLIVMLGVMAYLGINYAARAMKQGGQAFYDRTNFKDMEMVATLLMSDQDIAEIMSVDGVEDAEGVYQTTGRIGSRSVTVQTLTERISVPIVVEGRLPEGAEECVMEERLLEKCNKSVGDKVTLQSSTGKNAKYLKGQDFTIVGSVRHPDHVTVKLPENLYVLVTKDAFDLEELDEHFMKAEIKLSDGKGKNTFDQAYFDAIADASARLNDLSVTRAAARDDEIHEQGQEQIDTAKNELDAAKTKLDAARAELDEKTEQLNAAEEELADGRKRLDTAKKELADGKRKLEDGKEKLKSAQAKLEEKEQELKDGQKQIKEAREEVGAKQKELKTAKKQIADGKKELEDGKKELDTAKKKLDAKKKELSDAKKELDEASATLASKKTELDAAKTKLDAGKKELDEAEQKMSQASAELLASYNQIVQMKNHFRAEIKKILKETLDESDYKKIKWAEDDQEEKSVDDPELVATKFRVTQEAAADMKKSLDENIKNILAVHGFSDTEIKLIMEQVRETERYKKLKSEYADYAEKTKEWDSAHNEYIAKLAEYEKGMADYKSGMAEYEKNKKKYEEGQAEYDSALQEYAAGEKKLQESREKYQKKLKEWKNGKKKLKQGQQEYRAGKKKLADARVQISEGQKKYEDGKKQYAKAQEQLAAGLEKYDASVKKFEASSEEYKDGEKKYDTSLAKYEASQDKVKAGEREYADKHKEYENGSDEVVVMQEKLDNLEECKWFQFGRKSNAAYVDLNMVAGNLSSLGMTFSLLFILVGAMVCYATIGRMVDEQRKLVGATKALGLFNREIFAKYLTFGLSSTVLGVVLGVLAAYFGMQKAILLGYANMYVIGEADKVLILIPTLIVVIVGMILAVGAVYVAANKLLRSTAITLMKEEMPKARKKGNKKKSGSLYTQMIIANMTTDLRRVLVTVVSVAGCCALMLIGFTLKFSVDGVMDIQFGQIVKYDNNVNYNPDASGNTEGDIEEVLASHDITYYKLYKNYLTYQVTDAMEIGELLVAEDDGIQDFYALNDWRSGEKLALPEDGILIQKRLAESYGLEKGSEFTVYDSNARLHTVKVAGVFNNYTGRTMVMSAGFYRTLFGEEVRNNCYMAKRNGYDEEALKKELKGVKGFTTLGHSDAARALFASISTTLNALIAGLIFMAVMMALFVLLNLANMYILQKKRELTVMRINGFTVREVKAYVSRDNYVTTALGVILGIAGGSGIAYKIIRSLEQPHIQLIRHVSYPAWGIAALMTVLLALIVNQVALRKVKNLSLTDMV